MADMRLVVAGAGGRMGRTLVKAIADSKGFALAGAVEDARSPLIGWDAGTLAGMPENGIKLSADAKALLQNADGIIDFTAPVATVAFAAQAAALGKVHIIGTTGLSAADEAKIKDAAAKAVIVKSGNMSLGVNLLAALTRRVAKTLDQFLRYRNPGNASQPESRRAVRHRFDARARGGGRPRHRSRATCGARAQRPHRRA